MKENQIKDLKRFCTWELQVMAKVMAHRENSKRREVSCWMNRGWDFISDYLPAASLSHGRVVSAHFWMIALFWTHEEHLFTDSLSPYHSQVGKQRSACSSPLREERKEMNILAFFDLYSVSVLRSRNPISFYISVFLSEVRREHGEMKKSLKSVWC